MTFPTGYSDPPGSEFFSPGFLCPGEGGGPAKWGHQAFQIWTDSRYRVIGASPSAWAHSAASKTNTGCSDRGKWVSSGLPWRLGSFRRIKTKYRAQRSWEMGFLWPSPAPGIVPPHQKKNPGRSDRGKWLPPTAPGTPPPEKNPGPSHILGIYIGN
jgi:hypothetical protein